MADATWPGTIPIDHFVGLGEVRQTEFIRTATDGGPAKQRRRFTSGVRMVEGHTVLTNAQRAIFDSFYITTLGNGADEFNWLDPDGSAPVEMRFTAPPQFRSIDVQSAGPVWSVSLPMEILP